MANALQSKREVTDAVELDRHAFNLSFHGLGLRFHWDSDTYDDLCARAADANARTLLYLSDAQAHLLRAYDPAFLVDAIVTRMQQVRESVAGRAPNTIAFDGAESCRGELGF